MGGAPELEISEEDAINGAVLGPDGYIYRPPPASKQLTIDMQVSVTECTTWREVLDVVDRYWDLFDFRNTSTAIHRVARYGFEESQLVLFDPRFFRLLSLLKAKWKHLSPWGVSDSTWGLAKLQCRDPEIFRRLTIRAHELMHELDPQALALIAWAFATIGRQDDELMTAIAEESRRKLGDFGPQNIANLIWATATLGFRCDSLYADIVDVSLLKIDDFSTQELAMVNWALTKLAFPARDAWRAAFRARVMQLKEYEPSELSMIAWALATRGDYDPELMAYVARRSIESMRSFTGQNVATVIWAVATVSYKDDPSIDELLRMALGAIIGRASEFPPLNLALISWGLAKLAYRADVAFEALCASATEQIDQFVPQNLVQIVWACATSGYRDDAFLMAAARVAKRSVRDFSSQHLSNFIWACARLGFKDDTGLLRAFGDEAVRKMHEGSPQHLSNIAWAISQLGNEHFGECLSGIVAETTSRLREFDPPSLMMLSDSLFEAKYGQDREEPLLGILRGHVLQMGEELRRTFTDSLPSLPGLSSTAAIAEYQRRLRAVGLVTFGYEHTHSLFQQLSLADGHGWEPCEAAALAGWTTSARRTTVARRYAVTLGGGAAGEARLEDAGTIFTSAFASAAEDAACEFVVTWLGQGKADSPTVGRAGRSGDAECRAIVDTHQVFRRAMQEHGAAAARGWINFHTSGVPCLSCVGVAAQFKRCYPNVAFCFTFVQREHDWEAPDLTAAPQGPRVAPRSTPASLQAVSGDAARRTVTGDPETMTAGRAMRAAPAPAPRRQATVLSPPVPSSGGGGGGAEAPPRGGAGAAGASVRAPERECVDSRPVLGVSRLHVPADAPSLPPAEAPPPDADGDDDDDSAGGFLADFMPRAVSVVDPSSSAKQSFSFY